MHEIGRLQDKLFDSCGKSAFQGLADRVYLLLILSLHMADDPRRAESPCDLIIGVSPRKSLLNPSDICLPRLGKRGPEGNHQYFFF